MEDYTPGDNGWWNRPAHSYGKVDDFGAIADILGFPPEQLLFDYHRGPAFQDTGSVAIQQGRLITFPNVLEHRVEPFQLVNPNNPGHYRSITLYLVDPHYRVCSTRNVPPQQHHWRAQEMGKDLTTVGLPREIVDDILRAIDSWPMGMQEARQHRQELIKEHHWNEMVKLDRMPGFGF